MEKYKKKDTTTVRNFQLILYQVYIYRIEITNQCLDSLCDIYYFYSSCLLNLMMAHYLTCLQVSKKAMH